MLLKRPPQELSAIANLIINGSAKTTKQAERMVRKDSSVEFIAPKATAGGSLTEPQVSVEHEVRGKKSEVRRMNKYGYSYPDQINATESKIPEGTREKPAQNERGPYTPQISDNREVNAEEDPARSYRVHCRTQTLAPSALLQSEDHPSSVFPLTSDFVDENGDDVDDATQSDEEQSGKVFYQPADEVVEVVDKFNFSSNGLLYSPASGTSVPSNASRNHFDPTDVSDRKSANSPQPKADSEISEICNVLDNIFSTVQQLSEEQKDEVVERLVYYIGAETLGGASIKFLHQYEIAELCHKCFCAMNEETFPKLRLAELKVSVLKLLDKQVQRSLIAEWH